MEPADLKQIEALLRDANYQVWVVLAYEAKPGPFAGVPEHLKSQGAARGAGITANET